MKCTICGKVLFEEELDNINEICFDCQRVLEWIYEDQDYENRAERLKALLNYLKKHGGDSGGRTG